MSDTFDKKFNKVLTEEEHYVLNILLLSYLTDDDKYKGIAELCFMFDDYNNFKKFIAYYGGKTITIPTQEELRQTLKHLLLFQKVKIDGSDFDKSYDELRLKDLGISKEEAESTINKFYEYLKTDDGQFLKGRGKNKLF